MSTLLLLLLLLQLLIKSLYSKTTCSFKINKSKTDAFQYQRGVSQDCNLSLLLFNLFINELPLSFNQSPQCDPFTLPNGTTLNCLLYADDLMILSRSKQGLKNYLQ